MPVGAGTRQEAQVTMQLEARARRISTVLPRPEDLTPDAIREQLVRHRAAAVDQGGRGPAGNSRLTATIGVVLLVLIAVEGITLISLGPLLPAHVFVGVLLIPPVLLKLASTGYRMLRYYAGSRQYRLAGPPGTLMRMLGPAVVAATVVLVGSGVAMLALGPADGWVVTLHKASFVVWIAVTAVHVLGHVLHIPGLASADFRGPRPRRQGSFLRRTVVAAALVAGLVLAVVAVRYAAPWQAVVG